jgi:hypothetical protein
VNGDNGYIAMQVSGLEVLPGAGLTDSGKSIRVVNKKPLEKAAKINRGNAYSKHRYRFVEVVA